MKRSSRQGTLALGGALLAVGCAPVFSDLQSAKLVGRDKFEITPSYTRVWSEGEALQNELSVQAATGVHERIDLRARYVRVEGVNVLGVGPKIGLKKDRLALALPVGFAFGEDIESGDSWAVHPTLVLTAPVDRHVELNLAGKALVPLSEGDTLLAFNLGLGLGRLEKWAIRPELGFLINPGEDGHATQFSLGFTYYGGGTQ